MISGAEAFRSDLLADFFRVEAAGWKGQAGSAIACHPQRIAFYTALARRLADRGWLEWNLARFDGRVVAAHFGVRFASSLVLPKGGFDEQFGHFAPGNLLFWEVFARAFTDATEEVNFLTDKPWMQIWKMHDSTYQDYVLSPRRHPVATLSGWLAASDQRARVREYVDERPRLKQQVDAVRARLSSARPVSVVKTVTNGTELTYRADRAPTLPPPRPPRS